MENNTSTVAVETHKLSKRYGSSSALQDCTITVPRGTITALVGSNGAGKSTLLQLLAGLNRASAGSLSVFGCMPEQTSTYLNDVGFLAQEVPLYKQLTAADHIQLGVRLNPRWDKKLMRDHLERLNIPFKRPVGKLSGGQRAQVALALALAKKPRLLLLDEPVAALDPLARRDFLVALAQAVASNDLTVIMSSHLLEDLERICDNIIIMAHGHVQLSDSIDHVLKTHRRLIGSRQNRTMQPDPGFSIIYEEHTARQSTMLVNIDDAKRLQTSGWHITEPTIEDIALAYMGRNNKENIATSTKENIQ